MAVAAAVERARGSATSVARAAAQDSEEDDDDAAEAAARRLAAWRSMLEGTEKERESESPQRCSLDVFIVCSSEREHREREKKACCSSQTSPSSRRRVLSSSAMSTHLRGLAAPLLLLFLASFAPSADAAAKCITYFVKVPASPFSYKAGFAAWPSTCNPKFYK